MSLFSLSDSRPHALLMPKLLFSALKFVPYSSFEPRVSHISRAPQVVVLILLPLH